MHQSQIERMYMHYVAKRVHIIEYKLPNKDGRNVYVSKKNWYEYKYNHAHSIERF